jgi:beta-glucosidase
MAEVDEHVRRILRSMFATGVIDDPPRKSVVDVERGFEVAQRIAEQSIVLLKNDRKPASARCIPSAERSQ